MDASPSIWVGAVSGKGTVYRTLCTP